MLRFLYVCLLRLHPRKFRERFAGEMLWIFDEAAAHGAAAPLLWDALLSAGRQWALRPDLAGAPQPEPASDGVPRFYTCGSDTPRPGALLNGFLLSILAFGMVSVAIGHWTNRNYAAFPFAAGKRGWASGRASLPQSAGQLRRTAGEPAASEWLAFFSSALERIGLKSTPPAAPQPGAARMVKDVAAYRNVFPALAALDADRDGTISVKELAGAAAALAALDKNHDGKLTADEWGPGFGSRTTGPAETPAAVQSAERQAMRIFGCVRLAALDALDVNHDGVISAAEIANAPAELKALDKNGDGMLSADELLPDAVCR